MYNSIKIMAVCGLLALLPPCAAMAQDTDGQRWFRVELLVFSHEAGDTGNEQWEATPDLSYPPASRFLIEPERVAANIREYGTDSVVDEFGRQIFTAGQEPGVIPGETGAAGAVDPDVPVDASTALEPRPFVTLPEEQLVFRGKAAYMQRSGHYRTLFHRSWLQPVSDEENTLPIVLDRSGDTHDWPRLQGSIKLYLSRYLHLETNLWLNTQGNYLPGQWRMPAPPLGPPSLIIEEVPGPAGAGEPGPMWLETDATAAPEPGDEPADPNAVLEPQYPYRHAVLLQQKRRMRSSEIHYIDHPLLGVVVVVEPVLPEELQAAAVLQAEIPFSDGAAPVGQVTWQ